jgi:hypothetical protein
MIKTHAKHAQNDKSSDARSRLFEPRRHGGSTVQIVDNRPETFALRRLKAIVDSGTRARQTAQLYIDPDNIIAGLNRDSGSIRQLSHRAPYALPQQISWAPPAMASTDRLSGNKTTRKMEPIQRSITGIQALFPSPPSVHKQDYLMISGVDHGMSYHIRIDYSASDSAPDFHITWENNDFGRRAHFYYNRNGNRRQSGSSDYTQQNLLYKADISKKKLTSFDVLSGYAGAIAAHFVSNQLAQALKRVDQAKKMSSNLMEERLAIKEGQDTLKIRVQPKPQKGWFQPREYYTKREMMDLILPELGGEGWARFPAEESDNDLVLRFKDPADAGEAMAALNATPLLNGPITRHKSGKEWPFGRTGTAEEEWSLAGFFD